MAREVWRHGCVYDQPDEEPEGREPPAEAHVADFSMQADLLKEVPWKKVTRPSQRREMAAKAVEHRGVSIALYHCPWTNDGNGLTLPGVWRKREVLSLQPVAQR